MKPVSKPTDAAGDIEMTDEGENIERNRRQGRQSTPPEDDRAQKKPKVSQSQQQRSVVAQACSLRDILSRNLGDQANNKVVVAFALHRALDFDFTSFKQMVQTADASVTDTEIERQFHCALRSTYGLEAAEFDECKSLRIHGQVLIKHLLRQDDGGLPFPSSNSEAVLGDYASSFAYSNDSSGEETTYGIFKGFSVTSSARDWMEDELKFLAVDGCIEWAFMSQELKDFYQEAAKKSKTAHSTPKSVINKVSKAIKEEQTGSTPLSPGLANGS